MASETAFGRYQATKYFTALDGLRALSAALVVAWHTRDSPLQFLQGERGVTVFFVLSGFLITMLALREEEREGSLSIRDFFIRRVFRILPLYYVVLAAYAVLANFFLSAEKANGFNESLPWYAFYVSEVPLLLNKVEAPFNHSWSLGIEEKFYLVWPFIAFAMLARSKMRLPLAFAAGSLLLFAGFLRPGHGSWVSLIEPYGHILIGTALAFALNNEGWFNRLAFLRKPATYWALGAVCAVVGVIDSPWAFEFLAFPTALFVGSMVLQPNHAISKFFSLRLLVWLGTLSYAVYLIHPAVLALFERIIPSTGGRADDLATLVLGYIASALIGWVLHLTVEKPFIKFGRRFTKPRAKDGPDAAGAPGAAGAAVAPAETTDEIIDLTDGSADPTSPTDSDDAPTERDPRVEPEGSPVGASSTSVSPSQSASPQSASPQSASPQSASKAFVDPAIVSAAAPLGTAPIQTPGLEAWGSGDWVAARGTATMAPGKGPDVPQKSLNFGMFADPPVANTETLVRVDAEPDGASAVLEDVTATTPEAPRPEWPSEAAPVTAQPEPPTTRRRWWLFLPLLLVGLIGGTLVARYVLSDPTKPTVAPDRIESLAVDGDQFVSNGGPVRLAAVTQFGTEYACVQGWGIFDGASSAAAFRSWGVNAVRLPLNEHCWLGVNGVDPDFSANKYQDAVLTYVDELRAEGVGVVLSLGWSGAGTEAAMGPGLLPNVEHSIPFWQSVAARTAERSGVLFDLFVNPIADDPQCHLVGCEIDGVAFAGSQQLVDIIRNTGSTLPIVVSMPEPDAAGNSPAALLPGDPLDQLVLGVRARFTDDCPASGCWTGRVRGELAQLPALATLSSRICDADNVAQAAEDLIAKSDSVVIPGWNAWQDCGPTPALIADVDGTPTEFGMAIRKAFEAYS